MLVQNQVHVQLNANKTISHRTHLSLFSSQSFFSSEPLVFSNKMLRHFLLLECDFHIFDAVISYSKCKSWFSLVSFLAVFFGWLNYLFPSFFALKKFDAVTRYRIKDGGLGFFSDIALVLIDEVHLLNDPRGAVLEAIVSRIKMIARNPEMKSSPLSHVRFLAVSATIPNIGDLGKFTLGFYC